MVPLPALGAVTSLTTDREVYTIDDKIIFSGTDDAGNQFVHVQIISPTGGQVEFRSALANSDGDFKFVGIDVKKKFDRDGTYIATAFADDQRKENGTQIRLEFNDDLLTLVPDIVLELKSIQKNWNVEEESTLTFRVSVTDSSFTNLEYRLDRSPPSGAKIDSNGEFSWTPSASQGPAGYAFDIFVTDGVQEDRQTITIQVNEPKESEQEEPEPKEKTKEDLIKEFSSIIDAKKEPQYYLDRYNNEPEYQEWFDTNFSGITIEEALGAKEQSPEPEPEPKPKEEPQPDGDLGLAPFVDPNVDPQTYVDRYNDELSYKEWFDTNYPEYSSIYEAVGLKEPKQLAPFVDPNQDPQYYIDRYNNEPEYQEWFDTNFPEMTIYEAVGVEEEGVGICGPGTELKDGECTIVKSQEKQGEGGCLIATATFDSELAPQVQMLRELREGSVLKTDSGTFFMNGFNQFYYSFSPAIADLERQSPVFKETVKISITPLIASLSILNLVDIDSEEEMIGFGVGAILLNIGMYFVAPFMIVRKTSRWLKRN